MSSGKPENMYFDGLLLSKAYKVVVEKARKSRDLEGRRMRIAQIYVCILLYFLLKSTASDVSF